MNLSVGSTRCVVYCRVSTDGQEREGTSLTTQLDACRAHAAARGWQVVAEYQETGSGFTRDGDKRPLLAEVRQLVTARRVDVLLCYALDRLSRRQVDVAILAEECDDHGVRLNFVTEEFEKSAVGEFVRSAKAFAAEFEREKIRERTHLGRRARATGVNGEPGKPLPAQRATYGYVWVDDKKSRLVENPVTSTIVRRMFREAANGVSLNRIAAGLTADGILTPTGRDVWHKSAIRKMLMNRIYIGEYRAYLHHQGDGIGKRADKKGQKVKTYTRRPIEETVLLPEGTAEPLIDRATFDAVQTMLAQHSTSPTRQGTREADALLRGGYARCGYCGGPMVATPHHGKMRYECSARRRKVSTCPSVTVRAELLDPAVWRRVLHAVYDKGQIMRDLDRLRREDRTKDELDRLNRLLDRNEKSQRNIERAIEMLDGNEDVLTRLTVQLADLSNQRRALMNEKAEVEAQRVGWDRAVKSIDALTAHLYDRLATRGEPTEYDYDTKRAVLAWLGIEVRIHRTLSTRRRKRLPMPRPVAEAVADVPYEITARIPLDRPGPWEELGAFPVGPFPYTTGPDRSRR
jgi:site-specific DNA recombinase